VNTKFKVFWLTCFFKCIQFKSLFLCRHQCAIRVSNPKISVENKSFEEIRDECLRRKILFEDPEFPANNDSLFFQQQPPAKLEWKRPRVS